MSRRFTGVLALAILAGLSATPRSSAKPPDLPEQLIITVSPIQPLRCEFIPPAGGCTYVDRHATKAACPEVGPTVLDNLNALIEASAKLEEAEKHLKAGETHEANECLAHARKLAPGSNLAVRCEELAKACGDDCPCCHYAKYVSQCAHCWMSQAHAFVKKMKAQQAGKAVMVEGLLKAANLAMSEGRSEKAAELVRQAHALSPAAVEADPLVYKMHLLTEKPDVKGGEEAAEPAPSPARKVHPRQAVPMTRVLKVSMKDVARAAAAMQYGIVAVPKGSNGMVTLGTTAAGSPTIGLHVRCQVTCLQYHVCVGGPLPILWVTPEAE